MKIAYILQGDNTSIGLADKETSMLLQFLQEKGLNIHAEAWNNKQVQWESYDLVLLKSPWDYVQKIETFYRWMDLIHALNIPMLNSHEIVRWNSDKHYLKEIEEAGLKITPSAFIEKGDALKLSVYFDRWQTEKIVVKPCVGGASRHTHSIHKSETQQFEQQLHDLVLHESFIVQPFIPEVVNDGEWSLLFFAGKYSHALLKKPKAGDFRVQSQFGGTIQWLDPSAKLLREAQAYVNQFARQCLYARVDGVLIANEFHLMELELIEPVLYFAGFENGYKNYHEALMQCLETISRTKTVSKG